MNLGRGRADGLVAWLTSNGTIGTAALEAKSSRTLSHIAFGYLDGRLLLHALTAGAIGLLLAGAGGWLVGTWFWMWVFPIVVFLTAGFAYLLFAQEYSQYRATSVVRQVKRYPADELWIAISADAHNKLFTEEQDTLLAECKKKGIGLLRVQSAKSIKVLEYPQRQKLPKGPDNFLSCYSRSKAIRQELHVKLDQTARDEAG